jgi:hypothetical protein
MLVRLQHMTVQTTLQRHMGTGNKRRSLIAPTEPHSFIKDLMEGASDWGSGAEVPRVPLNLFSRFVELF